MEPWRCVDTFGQPIRGITGNIALYTITRQDVVTGIPNTF